MNQKTYRGMAVLVAVFSTLLASGCGGGGGGGSCEDPPNVEGLYQMAESNCPDGFAPEIEVIQTQCNVLLQATTVGFLDADGSIDDHGNFEVTNENGKCEGEFFGDAGTATCTHKETGNKCQLTYAKHTTPKPLRPDCREACNHLYDDCDFTLVDSRGMSLTESECLEVCDLLTEEAPQIVSCLEEAACTERGISACFEGDATSDENARYEEDLADRSTPAGTSVEGDDLWRQGAREEARAGYDWNDLEY